jgi:trans-aconitate 2-methyltransferase
MLDRARAGGAYDRLVLADAGRWRPDEPAAVIFSNAALHWLPDHDRLIPHLVSLLGPKGTLAVQMPANFMAPSHVLLREGAAQLWPDRFASANYVPPVCEARHYLSLLAPLGTAEAWETTYQMRLDVAEAGHPVRWFTQSTAMRPYLDRLSPTEAALLTETYDRALTAAYPPLADGSVLFPFTRLFFLVTRH